MSAENTDYSDTDASSNEDTPMTTMVSNIQLQCEAINQAPMTPAPAPPRCYLCYAERRRHHTVFNDLNNKIDVARRVFERFATDSPDAKEELKQHFQIYESERRKQVATANSVVVSSDAKRSKMLVYETMTFEAYYTHFSTHVKTRTHDTIVKNDAMNKLHDTIMRRVEKLDSYIDTALDSKEYKAKSECLVNEMRALMMVNQIMHMERYGSINKPARTIHK
jgi:hypothetical protein